MITDLLVMRDVSINFDLVSSCFGVSVISFYYIVTAIFPFVKAPRNTISILVTIVYGELLVFTLVYERKRERERERVCKMV